MIDLVTAYVAMYRDNTPDRIADLIADGYVDHALPQFTGRAGVAAALASLHARFAQIAITIDHVVTSADRVAFAVTIEAVRIADGQRVRWQAADFVRVEHGQFAELWTIQDTGAMRQASS